MTVHDVNRSLYCAIIGDIDGSRALPDRAGVQAVFEETISSVHREFAHALVARFLVTTGDELQGLLKGPAECLRIIRILQSLMAPTSISFGIGIGALSTPLKEVALGMDGEAFHRARNALSHAKDEGRGRTVFAATGPSEDLVNLLLRMADRRRAGSHAKALQILDLSARTDRQADVAKELGTTQQNVSSVLRSKALKELREIEDTLNAFFGAS